MDIMNFRLRIIDERGCEEQHDFPDAHALYVKMATLGHYGSAEIDRMIGTAVRQGGTSRSDGNMFVSIRFEFHG